jgi:hypothetical protein
MGRQEGYWEKKRLLGTGLLWLKHGEVVGIDLTHGRPRMTAKRVRGPRKGRRIHRKPYHKLRLSALIL